MVVVCVRAGYIVPELVTPEVLWQFDERTIAEAPLNNKDPDDQSIVGDVRRIRAEIGEQFGHDLDRLAKDLLRVEGEYLRREWIFKHATKEAADRVVASWGRMAGGLSNPVVDDVKAIRRKLAGGRD
jgi:hypothetical protein